MSFYIAVSSMLAKYGTNIKVWRPNQSKSRYVAGVRVGNQTEAPEERCDPVLPYSSRSAALATIATIYSGGAQLDVDLLWLSTADYPKNTVVEVPTQGGKYRVVGKSNYQDYSDLIIYQLKGDDEHNDTGLN